LEKSITPEIASFSLFFHHWKVEIMEIQNERMDIQCWDERNSELTIKIVKSQLFAVDPIKYPNDFRGVLPTI